MEQEDILVRIAKRENNQKRGYLVVNPLQGKHLPVEPDRALRLFARLAQQISGLYSKERLLVIGFAETATAIGAALAVALDCGYIQTTRETAGGSACLYFTEAHSHATEQKLILEGLAPLLSTTDRIIFAEDELTTGNTILDLIFVLEQQFGRKFHYTAACLLSGVTGEAAVTFERLGISLHTLLCIDHRDYSNRALAFRGDGLYHPPLAVSQPKSETQVCYSGRLETRIGVTGGDYQRACEELWKKTQQDFPIPKGAHVLVLGTEEFMYPGLFLAGQMQRMGADVRFHATTRSPIVVSSEPDYPLHIRYELKSLYDSERTTYVYELGAYDFVFLVTDAPARQAEGLQTLLAALQASGNQTIYVVRWCDD